LGQLQYGQPPLWNGGQISVGIGTEPQGGRHNRLSWPKGGRLGVRVIGRARAALIARS
jgi:hypothetical protein